MASAYTLYTTSTSPFGRKALIAFLRTQTGRPITLIPANPVDPQDPLRLVNPLGKMPSLVTPEGRAVHDSKAIVDYLDQLNPGVLLPPDSAQRSAVLVRQSVSDGIADAAVLMAIEELFHPKEHVSQKWIEHQRGKVMRGLGALADDLPQLEGPGVFIDAIGLACTLGYIDWRKQVDWRHHFPAIEGWLGAFRQAVPQFDETTPAI